MHMPQDEKAFDYVKLGPYIEELCGLKSEKTNQRLYKREDDSWKDITNSFWKKNL
jgi:anaerobic ribonucleoside-triphosphate reductase activating protein